MSPPNAFETAPRQGHATKRTGLLPAERPRKRLVRLEAVTDPKYGKAPAERTLDELLERGVVCLDKPAGPTSHQVAAWVRDALQVRHIGHGGTLDPNVTGALPVTLNSGVKAVSALLTAGKEYVALLRLHEDRGAAQVLEAASRFVGKIQQTPPVRSAVAKRPRVRRVYYLDVLEQDGRDVLFRVGCQAGTYIRNLCVDIGKSLGTRGHMEELRRTRTGLFTEHDLVTLQDCLDGRVLRGEGDETLLRSCIKPIEAATAHLNSVTIRDSAVDSICHGAPLAAIGISNLDAGIEVDEPVAIMSLKGELVAIANAQMTSHQMLEAESGIAAATDRVIMPKMTYPKAWKKKE